MLKICSRCLIYILKVKYTKIQISLLYNKFVCLTASLPAIRPDSTMARAPVFSHNTSNPIWIYETVVLKNIYPLHHGPSFYPLLVSFRLQIAYEKVRNSLIGVNKLVG